MSNSPMGRVLEHEDTYRDDTFVMIGLQGSQNYNLATEFSDVDTKILVVPRFKDLVRNRKPISTTRILPNDEHCDVKDIRLYWDCLRKQNINFVELLFTRYFNVNPLYMAPWAKMLEARERIARYNTHAAVRCMKGMALEKRKALTHPYPAKESVLKEFGYDPKQLHHILRIHWFLEDYLSGKSYEECLNAPNAEYLKRLKLNGAGMSLETAERRADACVQVVCDTADNYRASSDESKDEEIDDLLDEVLEEILTIAFRQELKCH